ncbi:MAG: helix-turn-helix domain-containing protein [bacterium]|nr:helix-turn-helix domain-containing protein [bacterium]
MYQFTLNQFTRDLSFPFFIQYGKHENGLQLHSHKDFSELVIVLSGKAVHIVDNKQYPVAEGDVFVISKDTPHGYKEADQFRICNIMYQQDMLPSSSNDITNSAGYQALFVIEPFYTMAYQFTSFLKLSPSDFLKISAKVDNMIVEYTSNSEGRKTMLSSMFLNLVTTLSRLYSFEGTMETNDVFALAKSVSYIHSHFTEPLVVTELASLSGYSTRHFARLFKDTYGATPLDYILTLRLNLALKLLTTTSSSVSEIGLSSGFDNPNYFSRLFRKRFGCSPSEYRSIHGTNRLGGNTLTDTVVFGRITGERTATFTR